MGLISDFIDILDKKWGEQAMQRQLDERQSEIAEAKQRKIGERQREIDEKQLLIDEKDRAIEALLIEREELLRIREIRVRANAAWERAFAERTGGTIPTKRTSGSSDSAPKGQS